MTYDAFHVSDERINAVDFAAAAGFGLTDRTELDLLLSTSTLEARFKYALVSPGTFALAAEGGAGFFTAYSVGTSTFYAPVSLVAGLRPSDDVTFFLGPQLHGAIGVDPPTIGAGFNRGSFGLLGGGVAGLDLSSASFEFCPQLVVLAPLATGATGTVVQLSFGLALRTRSDAPSPR
jgi:hypothetical protein